ncbi:hypothetical protein ACW9UO_08735 [Marinovum sp. KMM 9879]
MGWGLRHAATIIKTHAALEPEVIDDVNSKLAAARSAELQDDTKK